MTEVSTLSADALNEYFPNVSLDAYRFIGPPLDRNRAILFSAYACLFAIGTISNCYVACVLASILRLKSAETPRAIRVFVFALCCCDLFVLAFVPLLLFDLVYNQWAVARSSVLCQLYLCSESVNKFLGPFLLVALSAFCYLKICRPPASNSFSESSTSDDGAGRRLISPRAIGRGIGAPMAVVIVCAMLAFALVTPVYVYGDLYYLVLHNGTDVRLIMAKCAFHPPDSVLTGFTIYSCIFGFIIPAFLFTLFYAAVVCRVKRQTPAVFGMRSTFSTDTTTSTNPPMYRQVDHARSRRLERATRTCIGLILFYLAW